MVSSMQADKDQIQLDRQRVYREIRRQNHAAAGAIVKIRQKMRVIEQPPMNFHHLVTG